MELQKSEKGILILLHISITSRKIKKKENIFLFSCIVIRREQN